MLSGWGFNLLTINLLLINSEQFSIGYLKQTNAVFTLHSQMWTPAVPLSCPCIILCYIHLGCYTIASHMILLSPVNLMTYSYPYKKECDLYSFLRQLLYKFTFVQIRCYYAFNWGGSRNLPKSKIQLFGVMLNLWFWSQDKNA